MNIPNFKNQEQFHSYLWQVCLSKDTETFHKLLDIVDVLYNTGCGLFLNIEYVKNPDLIIPYASMFGEHGLDSETYNAKCDIRDFYSLFVERNFLTSELCFEAFVKKCHLGTFRYFDKFVMTELEKAERYFNMKKNKQFLTPPYSNVNMQLLRRLCLFAKDCFLKDVKNAYEVYEKSLHLIECVFQLAS